MSAARVTVGNRTRGTVIGSRIRLAHSLMDRTVGLLGTRQLHEGEGLWIENAPSIHMFFMRYPIDAIFLAADRTVVRVVPNLAPWRVVWWVRGARDCLEVPAGTALTSETRIGDVLSMDLSDPGTPADPPLAVPVD